MLDLTGYKLTFDDEFDARSISQTGAGATWADIRSQWRYDANSDIGFGHASFVDPASGYDPFTVAGGALSITAVPDRTASGYPGSWESGLITTQGHFSQTYGYFEMRADLSNAIGAWDAFWLLPVQAAANPSSLPGWQELDVVEHYGANEGVYSALHTTDATPDQQLQYYSSHPGLTGGYHSYGVDWEADKISFYFDGQYMGSRPTPSDMHGPMYLLADLATQNASGNNADAAGVPMTTKIDYIRAYSNASDAVPVTQATVSAPDGHDPGVYGATVAASAVSQSATPGLAGVYRFFDTHTGDHFYTTSAGEAQQIKASIPFYTYEGVSWATPDKGTGTGAEDVFRFFDTKSGTHFYTADTGERDQIIAGNGTYHYEGVAFEAYTTNTGAAGLETLERFFNTATGQHHMAGDPTEIASLKAGQQGPAWVDEGATFTVHSTDGLVFA